MSEQAPHRGNTMVNSTSNSRLDLPTVAKPLPLAVQMLSNMRIVLMKCFGPVSDSVVTQNRLVVSNYLQDIYRQSYFTTSNCSDLPLSPESCCLLTICYLSSLQRGERISVENLRTMIHYAQLGELDWLHYYKKHKKMSESTFVQAQLIHLSRVAVYPVLGKVRIVISNQSLSDGIVTTLQNMVQLLGSPDQLLPEYWVVLAVRPSSTIDFCVLVVDPLQVQLLYELKVMGLGEKNRKKLFSKGLQSGQSSGKRGLPNSHSNITSQIHSGSELILSKDILLQIQSFREKLNGGVLIPFCSMESPLIESPLIEYNLLAGAGLLRVERGVADTMSPLPSHLVEHRPRGPFQDQYNVAMHLLQKILSSWSGQGKIEEFRRIDFRVLCPAEASFVSQTIADIADSNILDYLKLGKDGKTSAATTKGGGGAGKPTPLSLSASRAAVEERVICCATDRDKSRFRAFLADLEANKDTLYVVVAENGHMTSSMATTGTSDADPEPTTTPTSTAATSSFTDNTRLLCDFPNCILVNVSSYPYSLQTNRSFVSFSNEIHWPAILDKSGLHYCSASNFKTNQFQNLESEFEYGVRFRDDQCFEEMFHESVTNMGVR